MLGDPRLAVPGRGRRTGSSGARASPERLALAAAIFGSLGALALLVWILGAAGRSSRRASSSSRCRRSSRRGRAASIALAAKFPRVARHDRPAGRASDASGCLRPAQRRVQRHCRRSCSRSCTRRSTSSPWRSWRIYLSLHPALYREWLIALFPPIHRDLVRDVLADLADSLRAYIVGQLLTMTFLGAITALGLFAARRSVLAAVRNLHRPRGDRPVLRHPAVDDAAGAVRPHRQLATTASVRSDTRCSSSDWASSCT